MSTFGRKPKGFSKLTPKDQVALEARLAGATKKAALLKAGYPESTATTQSTRTFKRIEGALAAELERQGWGQERIAQGIIEGAMATKDDGQKPDHQNRLNSLKVMVAVRGDEAPKQHNVNVTQLTPEEKREYQVNRAKAFFDWAGAGLEKSDD